MAKHWKSNGIKVQMKTLLKMVADFFKREWFLFLALGVIALIIALFEVLK